MPYANLQTQSYKFELDTSSGRWRWTTVMDVSGASPVFRVVEIVSPVGRLRDSIPIPGTVIEAMAASVEEIRSQFPPEILLGPATLDIYLDEGRGFSEDTVVSLTNTGVFGSLLSVMITADAGYVTTTPAQIGNLLSQETSTFRLAVDSSQLTAADSPYYQTIMVEDPQATNSPQAVSLTIHVRPLAAISILPSTNKLSFTVVKPIAGSFPPIPTQTFTIQNTGPADSILDWQIQRAGCSPWLSFSPVTATLASGATSTVLVYMQPDDSLPRGLHTETLRVSGYSSTQYVDFTIELNVL